MNSLLQALYHTPALRAAVFSIPTTEKDDPTKNMSLALQRVFFNLKYGAAAVATKELTKSFGWDANDSFTQHDVQEFNRVLGSKLEEKMKGTPVDGTIQKLFSGKIRNFIKCTHVKYESYRDEEFYDLSLTVKGCKDIYASFDKYMEEELLQGSNRYQAEGFGLQEAKKGCAFLKFPPVLHLQLKRFEFDFERNTQIKVNDQFEFPAELDLDPYLDKDADRSFPNIYQLHAVLVHAGTDVHSGHYYAFIRPTKHNHWFCMNDETVQHASPKEVIRDNFGVGSAKEPYDPFAVHPKHFASAYMLVYFRKVDLDNIAFHMRSSSIPEHLKERFRQERKLCQQQEREKKEAHLYALVRTVTEADLAAHTGLDLVNFDSVRMSFKVKRSLQINNVKNAVAAELHLPVSRVRLRKWRSRTNGTVRPDTVLGEEQEVTDLEKYLSFKWGHVFFVEVTEGPRFLHPADADDHLIFLKYFDVQKQSPRYVGKAYLHRSNKVASLLPLMRRLAGLPSDEQLLVFEEIRATMIDAVPLSSTAKAADLATGDILVFQKLPNNSLQLPTAEEYFLFQHNAVSVRFRPAPDAPPRSPAYPSLSMRLHRCSQPADLLDELCKTVGADPACTRLSVRSDFSGNLEVLKPNFALKNQDILFYEVFGVPIAELETKRVLQVTWLNTDTTAATRHVLYVPRSGTFREVVEQLQPLHPLPQGAEYQLFELANRNSRIRMEIAPNDSLERYTGGVNLCAQEKPQAELRMSKSSVRVQVVHLQVANHTAELFGTPFFIVVKKGCRMVVVKKAAVERLCLVEKDVAGWQLAIYRCRDCSVKFVHEDEILADIGETEAVALCHQNPVKPVCKEKALRITG
eukprot:TRINITY_DN4792_c0_g1_i1.p1 TRINITY_DN4792_c0_g1~~TRINITY_DN4792_c0_g1_i1.p1  ORF type:complete len:857 (-),score=255.49 TRINITY_DN4792_c0_g1_i1:107-2677(-)